MSFTATEEELYQFARGMVPPWYLVEREEEELGALVKIFDSARISAEQRFDQARILLATNVPPDFLDQHARDRGTNRQNDETDDTLRARLRTYEDALTRPSLLSAVQAILTAEGISGDPAMVELKRDCIHFGEYTEQSGTGGTFATVSGNTKKFTPDVAFAPQTEVGFAGSGDRGYPEIEFSGSADVGNDGVQTTTGTDGNGVTYENASGADGSDPTVSWTMRKRDIEGNVIDGFGRCYMSRGYRLGRHTKSEIIIILPYGTTEAVRLAVLEMVRQKKGAGIVAKVERRLSP